LREILGVEEDALTVEVRDAIVLRPAKREVGLDELKEILAQHAERLRSIVGRREPEAGELSRTCLGEKFGRASSTLIY
jgi:hypothetical protein